MHEGDARTYHVMTERDGSARIQKTVDSLVNWKTESQLPLPTQNPTLQLLGGAFVFCCAPPR